MCLIGSECWMFHVLQISTDGGYFGGLLENVVFEILVIVDLIDELVHARRRLRRAALEGLRTDNLAIVDDQFFVE